MHVFLRYLKSQVFSKFILSRIFTRDQKPTALRDIYRLFTIIVYLVTHVACFDAIFDCISNMIGRLFLFAYCQVDANYPSMEKTGFLDLHSDVHVTFYVFICFHLVA